MGKYLRILLIIFVGQLITLFLAIKLSEGAGVGAVLTLPLVTLFGIFIQVIVIFFAIKDTILARIIYSFIGLAISVLSLLILFTLLNQ